MRTPSDAEVTAAAYRPLTDLEKLWLRGGSDNIIVCEDTGCLVIDQVAHDRFLSILNGHAQALAVLTTSHIAAHVHDKFDVAERIHSKRKTSFRGEVNS